MTEPEVQAKTTKGPKSAFKLFSESKDLVMQNLMPFAVLAAIPLLMSLAGRASLSGSRFGMSGFSVTTAAWSWSRAGTFTILGLAAVIISLVIQAMIYVLALQTADGKKPGLDDIYAATKKYILRIIGLSILVGLVIMVGLIALIVPGLIFLRRYFLAPYVLIDKDVSITGAMRKSAELTKPYSGSIWALFGVGILLSLPTIVPMVGAVIASILAMLYAVAPALRYRELEKLTKA